MLVNTLFQKVDVFTKAVAGPLWESAMKLLSILRTYDILHTSLTGLKMSLDQALAPDVEEDCQVQPSKAPAQVKKTKPRNRRPKRIPQYQEAVKNDGTCNVPSKWAVFYVSEYWGDGWRVPLRIRCHTRGGRRNHSNEPLLVLHACSYHIVVPKRSPLYCCCLWL